MNEFNINDYVIRIAPTFMNRLEVGRIYKVLAVNRLSISIITNDNLITSWYSNSNFINLGPNPNFTRLEKLIHKLD